MNTNVHILSIAILTYLCFSHTTLNASEAPAEHHPKTENKQLSGPEQAVQDYLSCNVEQLLQRAKVAMRLQDYSLAESLYIKALNHELQQTERYSILMDMLNMYQTLGIQSKIAAIYEKIIELHPYTPELPHIYLKLGRLYRDMGAPETAISRFYSVLNLSLGIRVKDMDTFRQITLEAQSEIADTYWTLENYDQARIFYDRLKKLDLVDAQRETIAFKRTSCSFNLKDHPSTLNDLQTFIATYPQSSHLPEIYFMLASTHQALNNIEETFLAVKSLLANPNTQASSSEVWLYWQKKTANQVANAFYQQGDFMSALKIYQSMLPLSTDAAWQWPIIYQIGLCFEKLAMYPKAEQAYTLIVESKEWPLTAAHIGEYLASIQEMAKWRKAHITWLSNAEFQLNHLAIPENS